MIYKLYREYNNKIKVINNKPLINNNVYFDYNKTDYRIYDYFKTKKITSVYKVIKKKGAFRLNEKEDLVLLTLTLPSFLKLEINNENLKN